MEKSTQNNRKNILKKPILLGAAALLALMIFMTFLNMPRIVMRGLGKQYNLSIMETADVDRILAGCTKTESLFETKQNDESITLSLHKSSDDAWEAIIVPNGLVKRHDMISGQDSIYQCEAKFYQILTDLLERKGKSVN